MPLCGSCPARCVVETGKSRHLFQSVFRPAPPVSRQTRPALPCTERVGTIPTPTPHSDESAAFKAPADKAGTGYHSGSHTPCAVICVLFEQQSRWRSNFLLQLYQVCPRLPPRHSFELAPWRCSFRGVEYRSSSPNLPGKVLPIRLRLYCPLTGKGFMPLSQLSFSCSAFSDDTRLMSFSRPVRIAAARLPAPARVKRT